MLCSLKRKERGIEFSFLDIFFIETEPTTALARKSARLRAPQHAPKIHFRCAVIMHLEYSYSPPHFLAQIF